MSLEPGVTFRVAARFHCRAAWAERLLVNGGVERRGGRILPRDDWRPPAAEELRLLVADEQAPTAAGAHFELLAIPAALRLRWWEIAEHDAAAGAPLPGYSEFVAEVLELLRFKRLPVPMACAADVVVSRPGQTSTRLARDRRGLAGFGFGSLAARATDRCDTPIALINLGDERSHLVVLNLGSEALRAQPAATAVPAAADRLLDAFFTRQPGYPLVQVRLDPGEGLWFPMPPPAFDGWTHGKTDLDAMLILRGET